MTIATKKLTFEEYLTYNDGTDTRYELVNGDLAPMSLGTGKHGSIIRFIAKCIDAEVDRTGCDWIALPMMVGVQSPRSGRWDISRIPDVVVLPNQQWADMQNREAVIRLNEAPPLLVVEVTSPSTATEDYRAKHSEYSVLNIPEYWIIDSIKAQVTVCVLNEGAYDDQTYQTDRIISSLFPNLQLTAEQILGA
jgi:Uma2 family endonuclease